MVAVCPSIRVHRSTEFAFETAAAVAIVSRSVLHGLALVHSSNGPGHDRQPVSLVWLAGCPLADSCPAVVSGIAVGAACGPS